MKFYQEKFLDSCIWWWHHRYPTQRAFTFSNSKISTLYSFV